MYEKFIFIKTKNRNSIVGETIIKRVTIRNEKEIEAAKKELKRAGLQNARIWIGDPMGRSGFSTMDLLEADS